LENDAEKAGPAAEGRSVKISIRRLEDARLRLVADAVGSKVEEGRDGACGAHAEERSLAVRSASGRRRIEVSIRSPGKRSGDRAGTVASGKVVKHRERARGVDLEGGAQRIRTARRRRSVELPIRALDEAADRSRAVGRGEAVQIRQVARGIHAEERAER